HHQQVRIDGVDANDVGGRDDELPRADEVVAGDGLLHAAIVADPIKAGLIPGEQGVSVGPAVKGEQIAYVDRRGGFGGTDGSDEEVPVGVDQLQEGEAGAVGRKARRLNAAAEQLGGLSGIEIVEDDGAVAAPFFAHKQKTLGVGRDIQLEAFRSGDLGQGAAFENDFPSG